MRLKKTDYQAYLLRMWCIENEGVFSWRASLETSGTRRQIGFADLEKMFAYLLAMTTKDNSSSNVSSNDRD